MKREYHQILDWILSNNPRVTEILRGLQNDASEMLKEEPEFYEEINEQYKVRVKTLLGEEISRQLGMQIDIIFEVLETPNFQEYLLNDGLCFDDCSIDSFEE